MEAEVSGKGHSLDFLKVYRRFLRRDAVGAFTDDLSTANSQEKITHIVHGSHGKI